MNYQITLSDEDILSFNDVTGNIIVNREHLPTGLTVADNLEIHYVEDAADIAHLYVVSSIEGDVVYLDWIKQLGESLLKEANVFKTIKEKFNKVTETPDIQVEDSEGNAVKEDILSESVINEAEIKFDSDELNNPDKIDLKDKINKSMEAERLAKELDDKKRLEAELKSKNADVVDKLERSIHSTETSVTTAEMLFDILVPASGPAETVAGELIRAITRLLFRDSNDGDKFFEGYGIETCGSSAEYLHDFGFAREVENIIDDAYRLSDDDDAYTLALENLTTSIVKYIYANTDLLWTINTLDSRDYSTEYIEENQPRYEFELYGSDAVDILVEKGVLNSWDLIRYVEGQLEWESAYRDAEVARPWSHHDTSVTVTELTRDGYNLLKSNFEHNPEGWWEDLTNEYADELSDTEYDDDYEEDTSNEE